MSRYAIVPLQTTISANYNAAGTNYVVQANNGDIYMIYIDGGSDVVYRKSTDRGRSWGSFVSVFTGTAVAVAVWYDRWSGISAGLIHIVYQESATDDVLYRTINTESADALSTQTTIFLGTTTAGGGQLSVTRARGGNVYCRTCIDAGAEGGFFRLPNANVPNGAWDAARTINEALATTDQMILLPGFAADNQDIIGIFWDASADEISRQLYDDSANTWAETSIAASMVDTVSTSSFPHFSAFVDLANSRVVVAAWSAVDSANADLRCWTVDETTITEVTNVVLNSTDDQGLCALALDTVNDIWYCFYAGQSDGSETYLTAVNLYYKASNDNGTTWGPETLLTTTTYLMRQLLATPRFTGDFNLMFYNDAGTDEMIMVNPISQSHSSHQLFGG